MRLQSTLHEVEVLQPHKVQKIVAALCRACHRLPIVLLYLHGAHARGTQGALSDFDLAVLMESEVARYMEETSQTPHFARGSLPAGGY